ncbi:MAG: hypothetical protein ACXAC5_01745 [Promethearchaeota archaeon]|jgi:hypothetical protein
MFYETFSRAMREVKEAIIANPNHDIPAGNPLVAVVAMRDDGEFEVIGEVGTVMTLDDGRIGIVPSNT